MNHLSEPVDHPRPVEIYPNRPLMLERVERRAPAHDVQRLRARVPPNRLEEWMAGRHPFQVIYLGCLAIRRTSRVAVREGRQLPVKVLLILSQGRWPARWLERVREARDRPQRERHELGCLAQETSDSLRHNPLLLCPRASLDQHFKIELLAGQALQRVLTDRPELLLVDIAEEALFEVGIPEVSRVVVAQHTLDVGSGQDLSDDVEDCIVIQRVADLLELVEQPLKNMTLNCVGRNEIEDQAVLAL